MSNRSWWDAVNSVGLSDFARIPLGLGEDPECSIARDIVEKGSIRGDSIVPPDKRTAEDCTKGRGYSDAGDVVTVKEMREKHALNNEGMSMKKSPKAKKIPQKVESNNTHKKEEQKFVLSSNLGNEVVKRLEKRIFLHGLEKPQGAPRDRL